MIRRSGSPSRTALVCAAGLAVFVAGSLMEKAHAQGMGGSGISAGVSSSVVWTDNMYRRSTDKDSDAILEVSPYLSATSSSPRAKYRLFYQLRNFWRLGDGEDRLYRHALNGRGSFALVDDRLGVDLSGYMGTINASTSGAIAVDPASSFTNTAKIRYFSVSPWYRDRLANVADYQLQYSLSHSGGDSGFATAKARHRLSAVATSVPSASRWSWRAYAQAERRDFRNGLDRSRGSSGGALYYGVNPWLRIYGMLDYERIEHLRDRDGDNSGWGPGAGFDWTPFQRTNIGGSLSKRYYGNTGDLHVSHTMQHATMGLRWSRSVLTSADASLLLYDPWSLISGSNQFGPVNPILNSLASAGILLPPGTVFTQSLFTDAAVLDRRLTAFWGLRGVRNALTVSGFWSDRESTTEIASDTSVSGLEGSSSVGGVFVGRLRERGLAANYQYRIDRRSSIELGVDRRIHDSPTADFETRWTTWRLGYRARVTSDLTAFAGMRHTSQSGRNRGSSYDENAIYGGIDLRFH